MANLKTLSHHCADYLVSIREINQGWETWLGWINDWIPPANTENKILKKFCKLTRQESTWLQNLNDEIDTYSLHIIFRHRVLNSILAIGRRRRIGKEIIDFISHFIRITKFFLFFKDSSFSRLTSRSVGGLLRFKIRIECFYF